MSGWNPILAAGRVAREAFDRARAAARAAQWELLRQILAANVETEFGRAHRFDEVSSFESFRARVPIRTYDEFRPWLDRVVDGELAVLSREAVVAFEETGGSTAGRKLIPYTASGLAAFRAAVLPWLAELGERRPGVIAGRAYVAVSPAVRAARSIGGIPVGLPSEGAYLGADLVAPFAALMTVPPAVACIADIDAWRLATLTSLLAAADLTFISIWSPTFLLVLMDAIPGLGEPLVKAVRDGTCTRPADPARARTIEMALAHDPIDTRLLWPRLDTVSTWADGASSPYARRLQEMVPHAYLQPKGLLATEGAVTLPYGYPWPIPALTSAVLEFVDDTGRSFLCDELREGATYRVVLTNPNGFYRYDLGDRLRCRGHADQMPLLEFVGRAGVCSDLVGEKLDEDFVSEVLAPLDRPACLAPRAAARPFYELLVQTRDGCALQPIAALVERRLCANPQYAYARAMGQLGPLQSRAVDYLLDRHMRAEMRRGRRLADIKPPVLIQGAETYAGLAHQADIGNAGFPLPLSHLDCDLSPAAARAG